MRRSFPPLPITPEQIAVERKMAKHLFRMGLLDAGFVYLAWRLGKPFFVVLFLTLGLAWLTTSAFFEWRVAEANKKSS